MVHGCTPRQLSEIAFHDDAAWPFESWKVDDSFCRHLRPRHREFLERLDQLFPNGFDGKHVLDCGCGVGALSVLLALRGAQVDALDLSPKMVAIAQRIARESGVESTAKFRVAALDDPLPFDAGTFDAVVGTDVLHHVDLAVAAPELNRVVQMDGYAVFLEPVAMSRVGRIVRTVYYHLPLVPKRASEYEHAITPNELTLLRTVFHTASISPCCFDFFQHFARILFWRHHGPMINKWIDRLDLIVDKLAPFLRRYTAERVLVFQKKLNNHSFETDVRAW